VRLERVRTRGVEAVDGKAASAAAMLGDDIDDLGCRR